MGFSAPQAQYVPQHSDAHGSLSYAAGYAPPPAPEVLLLGPTGSGKTSFLNLLCNLEFVLDRGNDGLREFRAFHDMTLEHARDRKMESKTSGATLYEVLCMGSLLHVIDTPGFGDSRGVVDKEHVKKILIALEYEECTDMICLVINGRDSKMTATLQHVMSHVMSILPREVVDNVVVVFTNTADALDLNFDLDTLRVTPFFGRPLKTHFFIENPYCRVEKAREKQAQLDIDVIAKSLRKSFKETATQLSYLFSMLLRARPVYTNLFTALYNKKGEVDRKMLRTLAEYDNLTNLERQIRDAEERLRAAQNTASLNGSWQTTDRITKHTTKETTRHNTLCGAVDCYSNCHVSCHLAKTFDKNRFKHCAAMTGADDTCK